MRLLIDESCDYSIVTYLRENGFDVTSVLEEHPGEKDKEILRKARKENRVLLTEDRDFGREIFLSEEAEVGVILLRYPFRTKSHIKKSIRKLLTRTDQEKIANSFTVVTPGDIRFHKLPSQENR